MTGLFLSLLDFKKGLASAVFHTDMHGMDLEEYPLLHFPDLVLALLRAGRDGGGSLAGAARHLMRLRARAREAERVDALELTRRLERARLHLVAARLIEMEEDESVRTTERGHGVLDTHPEGVDDGVLMAFPEFRAWMEAARTRPPPENPLAPEFQDGWAAGLQGGRLDDNPYPPETAQHAAWEDGRLEARFR
jgi:restriction system protein